MVEKQIKYMSVYIGYNNQRVIESINKKYFNILFCNKLIVYIEIILYGNYTY